MRPTAATLCAQLTHALAAAESAGVARAREAIVAAVEAEVERLTHVYDGSASDKDFGALFAAKTILSIVNGIPIAMPPEAA